jgi:AcrR family transcriptional regulator
LARDSASWQNQPMNEARLKPEGLRERKRRQTLQRIAEVGLSLFLRKGYEATTLDEIAAAAGISRRTFFYYFKSKDEVLLAYLGGYAVTLKALVLESASAGAPLDVARAALLKIVASFPEAEMTATARLIQESKVLQTRRHATYLLLEQAVYDGLCTLWPQKQRADGLRLVAMVSIGALRLATEAWQHQDSKRPLAKGIRDAFRRLKAEIQP